jgi:hypothetical protein
MVTNKQKIKGLNSIIIEEYNNLKISIKKFPQEFYYINQLIVIYQELPRNINKYPGEKIPVLSMFWSCLTGLIIGSRLILEGHIPEAYALISRSAEAVAYARKMAENPEKISLWIKKDNNNPKKFKKEFGYPFPKEDSLLYPDIFNIYYITTNYGRHQNLSSTIFFTDLNNLKKDNKVYFNFSYFEDKVNLRRYINYTIYAFLKFLNAFRHIFKDYLSNTWIQKYKGLDKEYNNYKNKMKKLFKSK